MVDTSLPGLRQLPISARTRDKAAQRSVFQTIMRVIERYIFRRVAVATVGAFAAILGVVWVTQAVTRIDFASGSAGSITAFLTMMVMLTPQFITLTLPFGLLIGAVNVLNAMNADSEMPVLAGAGVSRWAVARPLLLLASLLGLFILFNSHIVEPAANRKVRDIVTEARTDLLSTLIRDGRFTRVEKGMTLYVERKSPGNVLQGILIGDKRDEATHLVYHAREGLVEDRGDSTILILVDGQIQRRDVKSGSVSVIRFQSYALSLDQFARSDGTTRYFLHEQPTSYLLDPDPNDKFVQRWPGQISGELHRRMTEWLYPALFVFIALAMAGQPRSHRTAAAGAVFLAFGTGLLYRWGGYFAYNEIKSDASLFWILYAIPLGGITLGTWMFMTGRTVGVPDRLMLVVQRMAEGVNRIGGPGRRKPA